MRRATLRKHTFTDDFEYEGVFWLPDKPEKHVPGTVSYNAEVINLHLFGVLYKGDKSTAGEALIEYNEVHENSANENRGGISVRDAQNATIQNNRFGAATIAGVAYRPNYRAAIIASDSGRSSRPNLGNILIQNNTLNREIIKGCDFSGVTCKLNTP